MSHDTRISESYQVTSLTWMMKNEGGLDSMHSSSYMDALRQLSLRITSHHVTSRHVLSRPSHEGVTKQHCNGSIALHIWMHCVSYLCESRHITSHHVTSRHVLSRPSHEGVTKQDCNGSIALHIWMHCVSYLCESRHISNITSHVCSHITTHLRIGWLRLVGSLK